MRSILRCLLLLLFVSGTVWAQAQAPSFVRRVMTEARSYATESTSRLTAPAHGRATVPYQDFSSHEACDVQLRLGSANLDAAPTALSAALCGPDTALYPLAKATGLRVLTYSDSVAFGQYYDAPQPITVSGMSFYAWVDSATSQTVTLTARLYNAGLDSLPTGTPLARRMVSANAMNASPSKP